jgi:alpha-tubulin suppressor-like RCC1 family protein
MRTFTQRRVGPPALLLASAASAAALLHCVGDDPALTSTPTGDAATDQSSGGDGNTTGDGNVPGDGGAEASVVAPSDPVAIAAGFGHACAVLARGDIFCWGKNVYGETGETPGGTNTTLVPHAVRWIGSGAAAYVQVTAAPDHTCAADTAGSVYCWGRNDKAQLGNKDDDAGALPTATPQNVVNEFTTFFKVRPERGSLTAQASFTCGVKPNGGAACWGTTEATLDAVEGSNKKRSARAIDVVGIGPGSAALIAGGVIHLCTAPGLTAASPVNCWGGNKLSQTGNGSSQDGISVTSSLWPAGAPVPTQLAGGLGHTCALAGGSVFCWGFNGAGNSGQPAAGELDLVSVPTKVAGFEAGGKTITRVGAGGMNSCVVRGGEVLCIGANESGQLGIASFDNTAIAHSSPQGPAQGIDDAVDVAVGGLPAFGAVSGGLNTSGGFACAIREDKTTHRRSVWCWGANDKGQLGTGSTGTLNAVPVKVLGLPAN